MTWSTARREEMILRARFKSPLGERCPDDCSCADCTKPRRLPEYRGPRYEYFPPLGADEETEPAPMKALSKPAQAVVVLAGFDLDDVIEGERERRWVLRDRGAPYHYWRERGDEQAPKDEYWCNRCVGFYGVPHDGQTHVKGQLCRSLGHAHDCRQCACLECVVFEAWAAVQRPSPTSPPTPDEGKPQK